MIGVTHEPWHSPHISQVPPLLSYLQGNPPDKHVRWLPSYASLNDIQSISSCTYFSVGKQPCIGLLFTYKDQSQCVVGQWRWDAQIEKTSWGNDESAVICCRPDPTNKFSTEIKIEVSSGIRDDCEDGFQRHPLRGRIIWWFSARRDSIRFEDDEAWAWQTLKWFFTDWSSLHLPILKQI